MTIAERFIGILNFLVDFAILWIPYVALIAGIFGAVALIIAIRTERFNKR